MAEQTSHIPGSPTQACTFRQQHSVEIWGTGELYRFGRSLKVTPSHICLPCRQTESEMERLPGGLDIKHHRQQYFRRIFNFMHDSAHICFPSFPLHCFFSFPLMLPTNTHTHTQSSHLHPLFPSVSLQGFIQMKLHPEPCGCDPGTETLFVLNLSFLSMSKALQSYVSNLFCSADTAEK